MENADRRAINVWIECVVAQTNAMPLKSKQPESSGIRRPT